MKTYDFKNFAFCLVEKELVSQVIQWPNANSQDCISTGKRPIRSFSLTELNRPKSRPRGPTRATIAGSNTLAKCVRNVFVGVCFNILDKCDIWLTAQLLISSSIWDSPILILRTGYDGPPPFNKKPLSLLLKHTKPLQNPQWTNISGLRPLFPWQHFSNGRRDCTHVHF